MNFNHTSYKVLLLQEILYVLKTKEEAIILEGISPL